MKLRNDHDGLLFFNKTTGVNVLLDETIPPVMDIAPRHMSMALTNQCNFSCDHCYISHGKENLDFCDIKEWIIELENNGCLSIGLGGGEPTMWPDLKKLLLFMHPLEMGTTLTTNGSADISFYREIQKYANLIRFSFDGLGEIYESYRKQSFNHFLQKILSLAQCGRIGINYLLTDKTILQLPELNRYIQEIHPTEILLIPCIGKNKHIQLSIESIKMLNEWISENIGSLPISLSYAGINLISADILPIQNFLPERQNNYFMHINPLGELMDNVFDERPMKIKSSLMETIQHKRRDK